jgi:hypothetical protein
MITNAKELISADKENVSTWVDLSNVSAFQDSTFCQTAKVVLTSMNVKRHLALMANVKTAREASNVFAILSSNWTAVEQHAFCVMSLEAVSAM